MVHAKAMSKFLNVGSVEKMLQHFENCKFIKTNNNVIEFGFLSESLQDFVRKEWLLSNIVTSNWPAFQFKALKTKENLTAALEDVRNLVSTVPFSFVELESYCNESEENILTKSTNALELVSNQFKKKTGTILRNQTFCPPSNAVEIFHKKQRERKNWWRKFSALPSRFVTCNVTSKSNDKSIVSEIQAEFPWGVESVETIKYIPDFCDIFPEVNVTKHKKSTPHVVSCEAILENVTFTFLCDSYEKFNENSNRDVLNFDRKLAPYKLSIAGAGSNSEIIKNLEEVSQLQAKQVRKLGLTVLLLPDACTTPVQRQVLRNDALGIPYTLILNDKTLQVGTVKLRSRDTMLEEDSHVSLIPEYLGKLLK